MLSYIHIQKQCPTERNDTNLHRQDRWKPTFLDYTIGWGRMPVCVPVWREEEYLCREEEGCDHEQKMESWTGGHPTRGIGGPDHAHLCTGCWVNRVLTPSPSQWGWCLREP